MKKGLYYFYFLRIYFEISYICLHKILRISDTGASGASPSGKGKAIFNRRSVTWSPPTVSRHVSSPSLSLSLISVGTHTKCLRMMLALEFQSKNRVTKNRGENNILGPSNTYLFLLLFQLTCLVQQMPELIHDSVVTLQQEKLFL